MRAGVFRTLHGASHKLVLWLKIIVLVFAGFAPAFMSDNAKAGQVTTRRVTIGSSLGNGSLETTYKFDFTMPSATAVQGMIFEFCDAPLGTCTKPNAMDVFTDTAVTAQSFAQSGAFTVVGSASNDCNIAGSTADTKVCVSRSQAVSESSGVEKSLTLGDILNPTISSGAYLTVYVRISIYSDTAFASGNKIHEGTVAATIVKQLTAVGRVAERLKFCVGAVSDDETVPNGESMPSDCDTGFPSSTSVDLGIIDNVSITAAPVEPSISNANLSNDQYGILQLNTNASGGVVITYFPETASSVTGGDTDQLRAFRVVPTDCSASATSTTDQCFVSQTDGTGIDQGTEEFGMAVACVNTTQGTTANFKPANSGVIGANYLGDSSFDEATVSSVNNNCENEAAPSGNTYVWGFETDTGDLPATLAHTTNSTGKVVDDEILKIRFGATASATTPTGTYTVIITYIATATF